jgi:hypothetical protein
MKVFFAKGFFSLTHMGASTSNPTIAYDGPIANNCTDCDRFYPSEEIECNQCNTNTNKHHQCDKLPSGIYGYIHYAIRKCSQHIRCICCQKYQFAIGWSHHIITYNSLQFTVFLCNDCGFQKYHTVFVEACLSKQMKYKNNVFIFILLQFHLLPHDLKVIVLDYCHFFPFDEYLVNQGFRLMHQL